MGHIRSLEMATCTMGSHGKLNQREADVHFENSSFVAAWRQDGRDSLDNRKHSLAR